MRMHAEFTYTVSVYCNGIVQSVIVIHYAFTNVPGSFAAPKPEQKHLLNVNISNAQRNKLNSINCVGPSQVDTRSQQSGKTFPLALVAARACFHAQKAFGDMIR